MEINQYPLESLAFQDDDFYDIDFWTGSGYQTKKILGSVIKAGILAAVENIYNSDGSLNSNRTASLNGYKLEFTGATNNDLFGVLIDDTTNVSTFSQTLAQIYLSVYNNAVSSGSTASLLNNSLTFELEDNGSVFTTFQLTFTEAYLQYSDGIATHKLAATANGIEINSSYILPTTDGSAGQVMTTDGAGVVSWQDAPTPSTVDSAKREVVEFINKTGAPILEGTIVYLKTTSSSGTHPEVELADASTEATSSKTIGAIYETTANDAIGLIVTSGEVDNLDTSMYSIGDRLWLSTTAGQVTTTPPTAPDHAVFIGIVTRSQNGNGRILYSIQNGYELREIHDVSIPTTPNNGDVLTYNSVTGLWEAEAVVGSNIYNTNGTLNANRVLSMDGKTLRIENDNIVSGSFQVQIGEYNTAPIENSLLYQDKGTFSFEITDDNTSESSSLNLNSSTFQANVSNGIVARTAILTSAGLAINSEYTLPNTDGTSGQVMTTDGSGNVSFQTISSSTAFIPPVESTEIRRGSIPLSGTTTLGTFGALSPVQTGSAVAVTFGGTIRLPKLRLLTTTGSTNSVVGIAFGSSGQVNTLGLGFRFIGTYIYSDQSAGGTNWFVPNARQFCGLAGSTALLLPISSTITLESQINIIGIGSDATDTNLQIFHNDNTGTATKIDLGVNFPANKTSAVANGEAYQLELYAPYGATSVKYRVTKLSDNTFVTGTISSNLPASTTALAPQVVRTSGSTSQNVSIDFIQLTASTLY